MEQLQIIDVHQFGEPRAGCVYLLRGAKTALVEAGTAASAPRLVAALRGTHLDYVFVTHVHLDHAGGAGHVAQAHPEATFVVHARGLPHLVDPTRLAAGVREASSALAPLYGEPLPIDPARVVACRDGESYDLGRGRSLVAVETPGHAPHHVCFFDPSDSVLFLGDAAGHHAAPVDLPLTVPPRFDVALSRSSISRLLQLRPRRLAFAHYGLARNARALLEAYPRQIDAWLAHVAELRRRLDPDAVVDAVLGEPRHRGLSVVGREVAALCVRGALRTIEHEVQRGRATLSGRAHRTSEKA